MDNAKQSVSDVQKEIATADLTESQAATASELNDHIEKFHADPETHHQTLRERMSLALVEFDADHHSLAEKMRVAIYDLGNAGV